MVDARTQRWAEHRITMRKSLVDATMRAIDSQGPLVSMREIAATAKIPKPTLYRFFEDKSELVNALNDRVMATLTERIVTSPQLTARTIGELIHTGLTGYATFVDEHPNVFRFLMLNFSGPSGGDVASPAIHAIETSRTMASDIAGLMTALVPGADEDSEVSEEISTAAAMVMGAVVFAADGWIGDGEPTESVDAFVSRTEPYTRALIQVAASGNGRPGLDFESSIEDNLAARYG